MPITNADVSSTRTFVSVLSGAKRLTLSKAPVLSLFGQPGLAIGLRFARIIVSASLHETTVRAY